MAAFALAVGGAMVACSKEEPLGIDPEPEFYTVQLGWEGEILDVVGYEPLTRANSTDDLYGIQVYSRPDDESTTVKWTPFAYGLFDGTTDITINLLKGYKYKFVATMVVDGKNRIVSRQNTYMRPFNRVGPATNNDTPLSNTFDYQASIYLNGLTSGTSYLVGQKNNYYDLPNVERFYGELTGAPAMELALTNSDNQISDIFTFKEVAKAWADNQYTETIDVTINWTRPDGTTLPLGTHSVTYKRNATTVVHVNIENDGTSNGFEFDIPEGETGTPAEDGENDITITDGEIVETDVDTNK